MTVADPDMSLMILIQPLFGEGKTFYAMMAVANMDPDVLRLVGVGRAVDVTTTYLTSFLLTHYSRTVLTMLLA